MRKLNDGAIAFNNAAKRSDYGVSEVGNVQLVKKEEKDTETAYVRKSNKQIN